MFRESGLGKRVERATRIGLRGRGSGVDVELVRTAAAPDDLGSRQCVAVLRHRRPGDRDTEAERGPAALSAAAVQYPPFAFRLLRELLPGASEPPEVLDRVFLRHPVAVVDDPERFDPTERVQVEDDVDLVGVRVERVPDQLGERACWICGQTLEVLRVDGDGDRLHNFIFSGGAAEGVGRAAQCPL